MGVGLFYAIEVLRAFWLTLPITTIYYLRYFDLTAIGFFEAALAFTVFVLEIPSGMLSDRIGHRMVASVGLVLFGAAMLVIGTMPATVPFLIAFIVWGAAEAFTSGAYQSALYEHVRSHGESYQDVKAKSGVLRGVTVVCASLIGAFLFTISPGLPFVIYGVVLILAGVLIRMLRADVHAREPFRFTTNGLGEVFWFAVMLFAAFQAFVILIQRPLLVEAGYSIIGLGIVMAVLFGIGWSSHRLIKGRSITPMNMAGAGLLGALALVAISLITTPLVVLPLVVFRIARDLHDIQVEIVVHERVPNAMRATYFSILSAIGNAAQAIVLIAIGAMAGVFGLSFAALSLAVLIAASSVLFAVRNRVAV